MYKQSYSYSFLYSFEVYIRFKFGVRYAMIVINSRQIKMREYEMITFALLLLKLLLKINAVGFQLYDFISIPYLPFMSPISAECFVLCNS